MMHRKRMGELLTRHGPLNDHDVDEILSEQSRTPRRFGEIAIALGKCQPAHVWRAWAAQLDRDYERIDLRSVGVDSQAIDVISDEFAVRHRVIPIRVIDNDLIVATDRVLGASAREALTESVQPRRLRIVLTDEQWITQALTTYYGC
jgi:hypothetical protein